MKVKNFVLMALLAISLSAMAVHADDNTDMTSTTTDAPGCCHGGGGHGPGPGGPGHGGPGPIHGGPGPGHGGFPGHGGHPFPVHGGGYPWHHWDRPYWERPVYVWDWATVTAVTCTSVDSNGNYYPVTEDGWPGAWEAHMGEIEDASLDRCFSETNGDQGCSFVDCEAAY